MDNYYYWLLAISWALVGLIWIVQLVHYPFFQFIDEKDFKTAHQFHTTQITLIVMPLMLAELGLSIFLVYQTTFAWPELINLLIVILIWASTFFIQIPMHNRLSSRKDLSVISNLVKSNWIRTILWTGKGLGGIVYFTIS